MRCNGFIFKERIWALKIPSEAGIQEVEISDPGTTILEEMQKRRSDHLRRGSSTQKMTNKALNWKCIGLRFGQIPSSDISEEGLYVESVKRENPGTS